MPGLRGANIHVLRGANIRLSHVPDRRIEEGAK